MSQTMTAIDRIMALRNKRDAAKLLLDAFDAVRADILPRLADDSIVIVMLDERRHELALETNRHRRGIQAIRERCSHAWERIGEARPPYWHCVHCADMTEIDPAPKREEPAP